MLHLVSLSQVHLPTALVARYRAVDRETAGSALVDTPSHLEELTADIRQRGILTPLRLGFNGEFAVLDGNHRIAVAIRLGLQSVPVTLCREPLAPRPHAQPMLPEDLIVIEGADGFASGRKR
jgi:ParB-like nuclease domain